MEYHDLDIVIRKRDGASYIRVAQCSLPKSHGHQKVDAILDVAPIGVVREAIRGEPPNCEEIPKLGRLLYQEVFGADLGRLQFQLGVCLGTARKHENEGVRLRLRLDEAPELASLPWEFLYFLMEERYLAISEETPLVRHLARTRGDSGLEIPFPIRVLVVIPESASGLNATSEAAWIGEALQPLVDDGKAVVQYLYREVTRTRLGDAIDGQLPEIGARPNILHFIGHAEFDGSKGFLQIDGQAPDDFIDDEWLTQVFIGNSDAKLIVLNTCEGATVSDIEAFAGIAPQLVMGGVPAVVAMQYPVLDDDAITFAKVFYRELFLGGSRGRIEVAITAARRAMYRRSPTSRSWGAPVLYICSSDVLFTPVDVSAARNLPLTGEEVTTHKLAVRENQRIIRSLQELPRSSATEAQLRRQNAELSRVRRLLFFRAAIVGIVALAALAMFAILSSLGVRASPELEVASYLAWFGQSRGATQLDDRIVLVPITTRTDTILGLEGFDARWRPWHGEVLNRLAEAGAAVVVFAILFDSRNREQPELDQALAEAIHRARLSPARTRVVGGVSRAADDGLLIPPEFWSNNDGMRLGVGCLGERMLGTWVAPLMVVKKPAAGVPDTILFLAAEAVAAYYEDAVQDVDHRGRHIQFGSDGQSRIVPFVRRSSNQRPSPKCSVIAESDTVVEGIIAYSIAGGLTDPDRRIPYETFLKPITPDVASRVEGRIVIIGREDSLNITPVLGPPVYQYGVFATSIHSILEGHVFRALPLSAQFLVMLITTGAGALIGYHSRTRRHWKRILLLALVASVYILAIAAVYPTTHTLANALLHLVGLVAVAFLVRLLRRRLDL
jgi:CHASE2 domain-containing sensor protein